MNELAALDAWCAGLLQSLQPAERRALAREMARRLRESQAKRIAAQSNPDGSAFEPRKTQARGKRGAIRKKMFSKMRTAKWMKMESAPDSAVVTFASSVQAMAKVHQLGLRDRVNRRRDKYSGKGPEVTYPARQLLGFTQHDVDMVGSLMLDHLAKGAP